MAFSKAEFTLEVKAHETPDLPGLGVDPLFIHLIDGLRENELTSSTDVPATKVYSASLSVAGAPTIIDLVALTDLEGDALTFLGLKIQLAFFRNPTGNNNSITIKFGATEGYNIFGDAAGIATLAPGAAILYYGANGGQDVADNADDKIDISGTGSQALDVLLVAGA